MLMVYLLIREKINCAQRYSREILDKEYNNLGLSPQHTITEQSIQNEEEVFRYSDYIFSPSPMVRESLLSVGIEKERIIETSYGWSRKRLSPPATYPNKNSNKDRIDLLFSGLLCVRKGAHLLLDIFDELGPDVHLTVCGKIEPAIESLYGEKLKHERIHLMGYVSNIGEYYKSTDIFVLPTLEEGSPMVTYEAMACGVPVLVSPMGAGPITRDGKDGYVINPHNRKEFVNKLQELISNAKLRHEMGLNSFDRAKEFIWQQVGQKRSSQLISIMQLNQGIR